MPCRSSPPGLINNVLYVIILSAALDLVGPNVPKGVVLLADVIPSFFMKLCAPYFIHAVPYSTRIILFAAVSMTGMLLIAFTPAHSDGGTLETKMAGVVLASLSSGGGELSFLSLTHFYGPFSLAAWGSGTGAAGLIGAGAYAVATTALQMSVKSTLLTSAALPLIMLMSFFLILPKEPLITAAYQQIRDERHREAGPLHETTELENSNLLQDSGWIDPARKAQNAWLLDFQNKLKRARALFFPLYAFQTMMGIAVINGYISMLPLLLVYIAEYSINQGVAPTLLFPLAQTPFHHYRAFYPTYNAIYQIGVFISRSSTPFFRIHNLYLPSFLQILNLLILILHALFNFLPNVYIIFAVIFWEGLLGGLVYVNTFAEILDTVPRDEREFSLGATSVSDSGGICIAGFAGIALEVALCGWQVRHHRDYCKQL